MAILFMNFNEMRKSYYQTDLSSGADNTVLLTNNQPITTMIQSDKDFVRITIDIESASTEGVIEAALINPVTNEVIAYERIQHSDILEKGLSICLSRQYKGASGVDYQLLLKEEDMIGTLNLFTLSNQLMVQYYDNFIGAKVALYIIVLVFFIVFVSGLYWIIDSNKLPVERIFVYTAVCMGLFYVFFFPPDTVSDEMVHKNTIYYMAGRLLPGDDISSDNMLNVRASDLDGFQNPNRNISFSDYVDMKDSFSWFVGRQELVKSDVSANTLALVGNFVIFFPDILAVLIGRLIGLGYYPMLYLAKVFSMFVYIAFVYFGIKKWPFGKYAYAFLALMPIAMHEAGSLAYDSFTNAIVLAFIPYCMHFIYCNKNVKKRDYIVISVLALLLGFTKGGIYIALAACMVLYANSFVQLIKKKIIWLIGLLSVLGYVIGMLSNQYLFGITNYLAGGKFAVDMKQVTATQEQSYTLMHVIRNPIQSIQIVFKTFSEEVCNWILMIAGRKISWLDITVPDIYTVLIVLFLICLVLTDQGNSMPDILISHKVWLSVLSVMIIIGVEVSMLVAITPFDSASILGIQGRYFFPVLPFIMIILYRKRAPVDMGYIKKIFLCGNCACSVLILYLLTAISSR